MEKYLFVIDVDQPIFHIAAEVTAYCTGHCPESGYHTDARRFMSDFIRNISKKDEKEFIAVDREPGEYGILSPYKIDENQTEATWNLGIIWRHKPSQKAIDIMIKRARDFPGTDFFDKDIPEAYDYYDFNILGFRLLKEKIVTEEIQKIELSHE